MLDDPRFRTRGEAAGVTLWRNAPMVRFVRKDGPIAAVEIERDGTPVTLRGQPWCRAGGVSQDPQMCAQHIPFAEHHISLMPPGNTGDGLRAAVAVGAAMDSGHTQNAAWTVISQYPQKDGSIRKWPHLFLDRPKPGCIIVNQQGRRFGDEASLDFVSAMHRDGAVPAHQRYRYMRGVGLAALRRHD